MQNSSFCNRKGAGMDEILLPFHLGKATGAAPLDQQGLPHWVILRSQRSTIRRATSRARTAPHVNPTSHPNQNAYIVASLNWYLLLTDCPCCIGEKVCRVVVTGFVSLFDRDNPASRRQAQLLNHGLCLFVDLDDLVFDGLNHGLIALGPNHEVAR